MASAMVLTAAAAARADAIDGDWCFSSRHLAIEGPSIVTPGGKRITGNYDRHSFVYTVPPGEDRAGASIFMILLDEDTMELRAGSEQAAPETWRRCAAPVS